MKPLLAAGSVLVAIVVAAILAGGCAPAREPGPEATLPLFFEAVQSSDLDDLYCLCAGAAGAVELGVDPASRTQGFERWALARFEAYLNGRDAGSVELDGSGIPLVQLFQLGRGTYYSVEEGERVGEDGYRLRTRLRFGYDKVDLSRLSPGTTFYVSGAPAGTIHAALIPRGEGEVSVEALDSIDLEWSLLRAPAADGCGSRWTVASVAPVAGTESTREITWVF